MQFSAGKIIYDKLGAGDCRRGLAELKAYLGIAAEQA